MDNCETFRTWVQAKRDGGLALRHELALGEHLEGCAECRAYAGSLEAAPPEVATRIPPKAAVARKPPFYLTFWGRWLAIPGATAAALLVVVVLMPTANDARFADHVHAVASQHMTEIVTTDVAALKPWFVQKLAFAPPVPPAAEVGCELMGGRIADIADKKTAAVAYSCGGHLVTVYVEPSAKGVKAPVASKRDGYHMVSWRGAKLAFQAVSDLDQAQLLRLAKFIQAHGSAA